MKLKDSIILIVVVIIAIVLGSFIGIKITENKSGNDKNNGTTTDNNQGESFSLEEAKKLMDKYKLTEEYAGYHQGVYYISDLSDDKDRINEMNLLALQWANKNEVKCDDVKSDEFTYHTCNYETTKSDVYLYNYEDVLNKKKELFGSNSTLEKNNILNTSQYNYNYISKLNGYVTTSCMCGAPNVNYDSTILSATNNELDLIIKLKVNIDDYNNGSVTRYYNYVFKLENNNYYLAEITEVK